MTDVQCIVNIGNRRAARDSRRPSTAILLILISSESFKTIVDQERAAAVCICDLARRGRPGTIQVLTVVVYGIAQRNVILIDAVQVHDAAVKHGRPAVVIDLQIRQIRSVVRRVNHPVCKAVSACSAAVIAVCLRRTRPIVQLGAVASGNRVPNRIAVVVIIRIAAGSCFQQKVDRPNLAIIINVQNCTSVAHYGNGNRFCRVIIKPFVGFRCVLRRRGNSRSGKRRTAGYGIHRNDSIGVANDGLLPEQHCVSNTIRRPVGAQRNILRRCIAKGEPGPA